MCKAFGPLGRLRLNWSPEQIAGWLTRTYPEDESCQVSHETIYRSLFVQARGGPVGRSGTDLHAGRLRAVAAGHSSRRQIPLGDRSGSRSPKSCSAGPREHERCSFRSLLHPKLVYPARLGLDPFGSAMGSFCQESRPRLYLIRDYSRRFAFTATLLVGSAKNRTAQAPSNLACAHPG
jgi:hypothetical protein